MSYIEGSRAPERALQMLGSVGILVLFRDLVQRAVSNWQRSNENGLEKRSCETALAEHLADSRSWDRANTSVSPLAYLERGRYFAYLEPGVDPGSAPSTEGASTRVVSRRPNYHRHSSNVSAITPLPVTRR